MKKIASAIRSGQTRTCPTSYATVAKVFVVVFILLLVMASAQGEPCFSKVYPLRLPEPAGSGPCWPVWWDEGSPTNSNARTAQAASESLNKGLRVAFSSGSVMGFTVVGLGMLDISIWVVILRLGAGIDDPVTLGNIMVMNGMGASFMALFARVGGGIYTKAPTWALTWWARWRPVSPRMTPATPPPSRTMWGQRGRRGRHGRRPV